MLPIFSRIIFRSFSSEVCIVEQFSDYCEMANNSGQTSSNEKHQQTTLADRLKKLDLADEQIAVIAQETSNVVQILNQSSESADSNPSTNQTQCQSSLANFSEAIKKFHNILAGELNYLQRNSSSYPHQGSVYINTMKLDLAIEASKNSAEMLKNLKVSEKRVDKL